MTVAKWVERNFFKVRNIMDYNSADGCSVGNTEVVEMKGVSAEYSESFEDATLAGYIKQRSGNASWVLILHREEGCLMGYGFLHTPPEEEWNDSLPTRENEARISSQFVYPEFRGKGIRGQIFLAQHCYARKNNMSLWGVIEESNSASMRAALKTGYIRRKNYLIKVAGRNILSVLTSPFDVFSLSRIRRARR